MSSWSDRPDDVVRLELLEAVSARDNAAIRQLLGEKHGPEYADEVIRGLFGGQPEPIRSSPLVPRKIH